MTVFVNIAKSRRFELAKTLNAHFQDASGVHICEQTVRNKLLETDFTMINDCRRLVALQTCTLSEMEL